MLNGNIMWSSIWCFQDDFRSLPSFVWQKHFKISTNKYSQCDEHFISWLNHQNISSVFGIMVWLISVQKLGLENHEIVSLRQCSIEKAVWSWKKDQFKRTIHYSSSHRKKKSGLVSPSDECYISLTYITSSLTLIEMKWRWWLS